MAFKAGKEGLRGELKDPKLHTVYIFEVKPECIFLRFTSPSLFLSVHFLEWGEWGWGWGEDPVERRDFAIRVVKWCITL